MTDEQFIADRDRKREEADQLKDNYADELEEVERMIIGPDDAQPDEHEQTPKPQQATERSDEA